MNALLDRFRLDDRVAVVTGSGRGIGRGIALGLAEAGADVVVTARRAAEVEAVVAEVRERGRRALGVLGDITDPAFVAELVRRQYSGRISAWPVSTWSCIVPGGKLTTSSTASVVNTSRTSSSG